MRLSAKIAIASAAVVTLGLGGYAAAAATTDSTSANNYGQRDTKSITIQAVESALSFNYIDAAPATSALGDQIVGQGALTDAKGNKLGTSSFFGVSTNATPRTSETLDIVYELNGGKITTSGHTGISTGTPLFDTVLAITGGTGKYEGATGEVRLVQESESKAQITFSITTK